jgi:putative RNA 2'-phosphotransferase
MKTSGRQITAARLLEITEHDEKQRFTICPAGRRIRAAQEHSLNIDLSLMPIAPADILYQGTASQALDAIFKDDLKSVRRRLVHLSPDQETAATVGRRHGKPVVLRVMAGTMHTEGHMFYQAHNGVWLTAHVPTRYLNFEAI